MKAGDRVRLMKMAEDPDPVPAGTLGTVLSVSRIGSGRESWDQVDVEWDNGRSLMLAIPPDAVDVLPGPAVVVTVKRCGERIRLYWPSSGSCLFGAAKRIGRRWRFVGENGSVFSLDGIPAGWNGSEVRVWSQLVSEKGGVR